MAPNETGKTTNGGPVSEDQTSDGEDLRGGEARGRVDAWPARHGIFPNPGPRPAPVPRPAPEPPREPVAETVTFDRRELRDILDLYGRKVAEGEWRDYAIDFTRDKAVFSIFRRASEFPLYRIEKAPRLARKQGAFSVVTTTGLILKRGHELDRVIAVLDRKLKVVKP
jgi:hypothetical protein